MKEKFIEWFTAGNSGYAPAIDADGKFEKEKTQHMWEAYQAGLASAEAQVKQLTEANQQLRDEALKSTSALYDVVAENVGMDSFVESMLAIAWQGSSADGSDIQELALKCGLIRQEVYCADKHENTVDDPGNFEDGDALYFRVETPATDAILASLRAEAITDALENSSEYLDTDCVMDRHDISYQDAELRAAGAMELRDSLVAGAKQLRSKSERAV